jgi:RNA polymerase sigma-70 factor (ECF subfamily)
MPNRELETQPEQPVMTVAEIAREYEPILYARAIRLLRNPSDAWDLVQDTFERALRGYPRFQQGSNLRVWLMTIMQHLFIDRCRKQSREPAAEQIDDEQIATPESVPRPSGGWEEITDEQVADALSRLESPFREVYQLRLLDNCSYDEIAERLLIPRATVGTRLMRARKKLKETLLQGLEEDPLPLAPSGRAAGGGVRAVSP